MKPADNHSRTKHDGRMTAIIAREAAKFIGREATNESLITVIRAESSAHGTLVTVFVSVFPIDRARAALTFLDRQRETFSDYLKTHTALSPLPRIDFALSEPEQLPE